MDTIVADIAVVQALEGSSEIEELVSDRIFNTARPEKEEKEDNIPYIIVTYEGMVPTNENKDYINGASDEERVNVLCVAEDRASLAALINRARTAIDETLDSPDYAIAYRITDFSASATTILYDWTVPCVYQSLQYTIETSKE